MSRSPKGYEPDMFSEHAQMAQLGSRVLAILRDRSRDRSDSALWLGVLGEIERLGFLDEHQEDEHQEDEPVGAICAVHGRNSCGAYACRPADDERNELRDLGGIS